MFIDSNISNYTSEVYLRALQSAYCLQAMRHQIMPHFLLVGLVSHFPLQFYVLSFVFSDLPL